MSQSAKRVRLDDGSQEYSSKPHPSYAQPSYAQPSYAQPSYAQPGYVQPGYVRPSYTQPSYLQPGHAQPVYVQPGYPQLDYGNMISQLDDGAVRQMLISLAMTSPSVQNAITVYYQQLVQVRRSRVINFDQHSKDAWHVLNTSEYTEGSGSKQYEASWDAMSDVQDCVKAIGEKTYAESSYGTKLSALETLRKIAKTLLLADDTLGSEVRKRFQEENCIADEMLRIAQSMSLEELLRAGATSDAKGSLAEKVRWVYDEWDANCLQGSEDLYVVLNLLLGEDGSKRGR